MTRGADIPRDAWIDELERDLDVSAVARLLTNAGGQRRNIPQRAAGSKLAEEVGVDVVAWLSARFAGTSVDVPSRLGRDQQDRAAALRAAILEAGLTDPVRSANDIAREHGVTAAWVHKLRAQMRDDYGLGNQFALPLG